MADEIFMGEERCGNCIDFDKGFCYAGDAFMEIPVDEDYKCLFDPSRFEPNRGTELGSTLNAKDLEGQND